MNNQMFQIGEIAITQGMLRECDNGTEVTILGPMEFCGAINIWTGTLEPRRWRYPTTWPSLKGPVWITYWRLRKKRPPSEEIPEMEGFEVEA